jgi:hypothetical protein
MIGSAAAAAVVLSGLVVATAPVEAAASSPPARCLVTASDDATLLDFENIVGAKRIIVRQGDYWRATLGGDAVSWQEPSRPGNDDPYKIWVDSLDRSPRYELPCSGRLGGIGEIDLGADLMACHRANVQGRNWVFVEGDFGDSSVHLRSDTGWIADVTGWGWAGYDGARADDSGLFIRVRARHGGPITDIACTEGRERVAFRRTAEQRPAPVGASADNAGFSVTQSNGIAYVTTKAGGAVRTFSVSHIDFDDPRISDDGSTLWWMHEGTDGMWADLNTFEGGSQGLD